MLKFIASFLFLSSIILGQNNKSKSTTNDWKTFDHTNFSIQYPKDWDMTTLGQMSTTFILFAKLESKDDEFRENINLIIQDISGHNHLDLDKFTEVSVEQIKTLIDNSKIIENKKIKNDKGEYQKIIYTGDQGIYHLKYTQYYWVMNNKSYVLTFTTELSKYNNYKEKGEKIMNSFILKK